MSKEIDCMSVDLGGGRSVCVSCDIVTDDNGADCRFVQFVNKGGKETTLYISDEALYALATLHDAVLYDESKGQ